MKGGDDKARLISMIDHVGRLDKRWAPMRRHMYHQFRRLFRLAKQFHHRLMPHMLSTAMPTPACKLEREKSCFSR